MPRSRRLLSIGHSYSVGVNRRLPHELASSCHWDVTVVGPSVFTSELGTHVLEPAGDEACRVEGVPVHFSRPIHLMTYGRRLAEILREPWDLVHCWEEPYILAGGQVARWLPRDTPLVFATFQNIAKQYPPPLNWVEGYAMARATGWIAFGYSVAQALRGRALFDARPSRVIHPGVDTDLFKPDAEARAAVYQTLGWTVEGPPVVGFLGRLVPEKGVDMLTELLDGISAPWRGLIVGTGPLEPALRAWSARHPDRVRLVASATHNEVPRFLNAMDVLCAPSRTTARWREQFGRMLIEAFACGVPVVASDSGEIPYVVREAGTIVGESDRAGWRRALETLLLEPGLRRTLSGRGRDRALSAFSWASVARQHDEFFSELLDEPRQALAS